MSSSDRNEVEFRFFGSGGSAKGPWGIAAFVVLAICAMVTLVILAKFAPILASTLIGWARYRFS